MPFDPWLRSLRPSRPVQFGAPWAPLGPLEPFWAYLAPNSLHMGALGPKVKPGSLKVWPGSLKVWPSKSYGAGRNYILMVTAEIAARAWRSHARIVLVS